MAATDNLPAGAAANNSDATRQSNLAAWFNSFEGVLSGIDDAPRITPSNDGSQILGYGSSLGVDIGVGNNGEFYARGRVGQVGSDDATKGQAVGAGAAQKFTISPGLLIAALVAFLIFRK